MSANMASSTLAPSYDSRPSGSHILDRTPRRLHRVKSVLGLGKLSGVHGAELQLHISNAQQPTVKTAAALIESRMCILEHLAQLHTRKSPQWTEKKFNTNTAHLTKDCYFWTALQRMYCDSAGSSTIGRSYLGSLLSGCRTLDQRFNMAWASRAHLINAYQI